VQLILFSILDTGENKDMGHLRKKMETIHCMGHKCSRKKHYYSRKCPKCVEICAFYGTAKNQDIELLENKNIVVIETYQTHSRCLFYTVTSTFTQYYTSATFSKLLHKL